MPRRFILGGIVSLWIAMASGQAHANIFSDLWGAISCGSLKYGPTSAFNYFAVREALQVAVNNGVIADKDTCQSVGDTVVDGLGFIGPGFWATAKNCLCDDISYPLAPPLPPPPPPLCPIAHNVCTAGSSLPRQIGDGTSCTPSVDALMATLVCDPGVIGDDFCCENEWDSLCVSEVPSAIAVKTSQLQQRIDEINARHCDGLFGFQCEVAKALDRGIAVTRLQAFQTAQAQILCGN